MAKSTIIRTSNVPMIRAVHRHTAANRLGVFITLSIWLLLFIDQFLCAATERSFH
jgi:hypothetical protein